jgi:hypothetical protein
MAERSGCNVSWAGSGWLRSSVLASGQDLHAETGSNLTNYSILPELLYPPSCSWNFATLIDHIPGVPKSDVQDPRCANRKPLPAQGILVFPLKSAWTPKSHVIRFVPKKRGYSKEIVIDRANKSLTSTNFSAAPK